VAIVQDWANFQILILQIDSYSDRIPTRMKRILGCVRKAFLMAVIFSMPCRALETLAYHFVDEPTWQPRVAECPRVEKSPTPTPFVKDGDVLCDLTPSVRASGLPIKDGWVLWNQTKRWLIVHGAMSEQWWIASKLGFDGQEHRAKITLDWFRTVDSEHPPKDQDVPMATLKANCLTGGYKAYTEQVIKLKEGDWSFEMDAEVYSSYGVSWLTLYAGLRGPGGDQSPVGFINTSIRQEDGKPQIIASWYAGQKDSAWWLRLTTDVVLRDGKSRREARLRQVGDAFVAWPSETPEQKCRTIPEKYRGQVSIGNEIEYLHEFTMDKSGKDANEDVFNGKVDVGALIRKNALKKLPQAKIPEWLKEIAAPPMLDLRQSISEYKIELNDDDFIAFDPETFLIIRASKKLDTFESLNMIFEGLCGGKGNDVKSQTWLEDSANPGVSLAKISIISETCSVSKIDWSEPLSSTKFFLRQEYMPDHEGVLEVWTIFEGRVKKLDGTVFEWKEQTKPKLAVDKIDEQDWKKLPNDQVIKKFQKVWVSPER
jgi:hypothetical protein